VPSKKSLPCFN